MQSSKLPPPQASGDSCKSMPPMPPPAAAAAAGVADLAETMDCVDPKMTVMGGGEKEKAADYANCECIFIVALFWLCGCVWAGHASL